MCPVQHIAYGVMSALYLSDSTCFLSARNNDLIKSHAWLHKMIGLDSQWPRPAPAAPEQEQAQDKNSTRPQKLEDNNSLQGGTDTS